MANNTVNSRNIGVGCADQDGGREGISCHAPGLVQLGRMLEDVPQQAPRVEAPRTEQSRATPVMIACGWI